MCLTCGCDTPDDNHGDSRHITLSQLKASAKADGITPAVAAHRVVTATTKTPKVSKTAAKPRTR